MLTKDDFCHAKSTGNWIPVRVDAIIAVMNAYPERMPSHLKDEEIEEFLKQNKEQGK